MALAAHPRATPSRGTCPAFSVPHTPRFPPLSSTARPATAGKGFVCCARCLVPGPSSKPVQPSPASAPTRPPCASVLMRVGGGLARAGPGPGARPCSLHGSSPTPVAPPGTYTASHKSKLLGAKGDSLRALSLFATSVKAFLYKSTCLRAQLSPRSFTPLETRQLRDSPWHPARLHHLPVCPERRGGALPMEPFGAVAGPCASVWQGDSSSPGSWEGFLEEVCHCHSCIYPFI